MSLQYHSSFDGTSIAWRVVGDGPDWLVLAHGYGGTFNAWDPVLSRLQDRFRVLMWDYRGMHASACPAEPHRLRIEDHIRDLDGLLDHVGVDRFILGGWSVGVQVALEGWRRLRHRADIRALILINGAH
ncbi:MAG: alpha/beta hydrolase, partial [bacterium]